VFSVPPWFVIVTVTQPPVDAAREPLDARADLLAGAEIGWGFLIEADTGRGAGEH
jgi:hypothetical protein